MFRFVFDDRKICYDFIILDGSMCEVKWIDHLSLSVQRTCLVWTGWCVTVGVLLWLMQ